MNISTATEQKTEQPSAPLPPLLRLSRRATTFLFLTLCALQIFYIAGSRQNFLTSNIQLILKLLCFNSIPLFFFSLISIISTVYFALKLKKFTILLNMFFFILTLLISIITVFLSLSINTLSEGLEF